MNKTNYAKIQLLTFQIRVVLSMEFLDFFFNLLNFQVLKQIMIEMNSII